MLQHLQSFIDAELATLRTRDSFLSKYLPVTRGQFAASFLSSNEDSPGLVVSRGDVSATAELAQFISHALAHAADAAISARAIDALDACGLGIAHYCAAFGRLDLLRDLKRAGFDLSLAGVVTSANRPTPLGFVPFARVRSSGLDRQDSPVGDNSGSHSQQRQQQQQQAEQQRHAAQVPLLPAEAPSGELRCC